MFSSQLKAAIGMGLVLLVGGTAAQADEGAVRQASQNTQVRFRVGNQVNWSMTGHWRDSALMVRGDGTVIAAGTFDQLFFHPRCVNIVYNSDGRITLRFQIDNARPELNGGYVRVVSRNGQLIDQDPFVRE